MKQTINIATDFSPEPYGRYPSDGKDNGTRFRDDWLVPGLKKFGAVTIVMDGAEGYGSSFLEEAFGGLVRFCNYSAVDLHAKLQFVSKDDPSLEVEIWSYIDDAKPEIR